MKFYHTPNLTILNSALVKVYSNITRDFEESKHFREYDRAQTYLKKTVYFVEKNLIEALLLLKKDFSYSATTTEDFKGKDISNWFLIDGSIGIENVAHKSNHFCISVAIRRDNKIIATMFYNPVKNEAIACEAGFGLMYNNQKIRYSESTLSGYNNLVVEQDVLKTEKAKELLNNKLQISSALEFDIALVCAKRLKAVILTKQSYESIANTSCGLMIKESQIPVKEIAENIVVIGKFDK